MRKIGGNVGDAGFAREGKREGRLAHVSVDRVCVCLLLAVYQCVCFDISVSYRAAVSP